MYAEVISGKHTAFHVARLPRDSVGHLMAAGWSSAPRWKSCFQGWPHVWVIVQSFSCRPPEGCVDLALANRNKQYFFTIHSKNRSTPNISRDTTFLKYRTGCRGESRKWQNHENDERTKTSEVSGTRHSTRREPDKAKWALASQIKELMEAANGTTLIWPWDHETNENRNWLRLHPFF